MGSGLTIPSGSAHGQLGWMGGVKLTKALAFIFILLRGSNCFYGDGGGGGSIPVCLWEPR